LKNYEESDGFEKEMAVSDMKSNHNDSFTTMSGSAIGTTMKESMSSDDYTSQAGTLRSGDTSTIFGGQPGVVVSELCNVLDYRPSQSSIQEGDDSESDDSRIRLPVVHEEGVSDDDFMYSDVSYKGGMSINIRHSLNDVVNSNTSVASDTDDGSGFQYSDLSFVGGMSTNTRQSKEGILNEGTFKVDGEEFDVDVEMDDSGDSNDESFDVEIEEPRPTAESSGGMSELTFRHTTSSDNDDLRSSFDLQGDIRLGNRDSSMEFDMVGDDMSLGTTGNFTVTTRNTEGDDESKVDNGVKIKETLFYM
jgi:hypothetical protein